MNSLEDFAREANLINEYIASSKVVNVWYPPITDFVVALRKYEAVHTTNIIATPNSDIRLLFITIIKATSSNQIVMHDKSLFRAIFSFIGEIINTNSQDMIKIGTDDPYSLRPSHIIDFLCNITRLVINVTELQDTLHAEVLKCYLNVLERWEISEEEKIRFLIITVDIMPSVTNYHSYTCPYITTYRGATMTEIIENSSNILQKVFCECIKQETLDEVYWKRVFIISDMIAVSGEYFTHHDESSQMWSTILSCCIDAVWAIYQDSGEITEDISLQRLCDVNTDAKQYICIVTRQFSKIQAECVDTYTRILKQLLFTMDSLGNVLTVLQESVCNLVQIIPSSIDENLKYNILELASKFIYLAKVDGTVAQSLFDVHLTLLNNITVETGSKRGTGEITRNAMNIAESASNVLVGIESLLDFLLTFISSERSYHISMVINHLSYIHRILLAQKPNDRKYKTIFMVLTAIDPFHGCQNVSVIEYSVLHVQYAKTKVLQSLLTANVLESPVDDTETFIFETAIPAIWKLATTSSKWDKKIHIGVLFAVFYHYVSQSYLLRQRFENEFLDQTIQYLVECTTDISGCKTHCYLFILLAYSYIESVLPTNIKRFGSEILSQVRRYPQVIIDMLYVLMEWAYVHGHDWDIKAYHDVEDLLIWKGCPARKRIYMFLKARYTQN
jgi:hypothetical protein